MRSIAIHLLFFLSVLVQGQPFRFQHLGVQDGLESNKVYMSIEDGDGFMWIATDGGVSKYDGRHLTSYSLEKIEGVKQRTNLTIHLAIDNNDLIWLVSNNGLVFYFDIGLDQFRYFDQILSETNRGIYVSEFHIDHNNQFVLGSYNNAFLFDPASRQATRIPEISGTVKSIIQSSDHRYFIGSRNGVAVFDQNFQYVWNLKEQEIDQHWLPDNQKIESLFFQESENKLWIGSEKSGLYYYDLTHHQLSSSGPIMGNVDVHIRSIIDFEAGKFMVGTDGGGVFIYDSFNAEVIDQLVYDEYEEHSLNSNAIYDIFVNSQGVVFISTFRGGVNMYNPQRQNFSKIRHIRGDNNSLKNDVVLSIEELPQGISFGTDEGISLWDKALDSWKHLSINPAGFGNKSEVAWSQSLDANGNLWVASFIYPLSLLKADKGAYLLQPSSPLSQIRGTTKKVYHHPHGELLVGTINSGLYTYHPSGELMEYPIQEAGDFEVYSAEKVIINSRDGIAMLDLEYQEMSWMNEGLIGDSLNNKATVSLLIDDERNLWVGTLNNGIYIFNTQLNRVRSVNTSAGLASNQILDLVSDSEGHVWAATSLGISKIEGEHMFNFHKSDGLISTDFNRNSAIQDKDGRLYFGTNQGVITFDPLSIKPSHIKKTLVLTEFFLNHQRIQTEEHSILTKPLKYTHTLTLAYKQNSFSIGFTSIDFLHPEQGEYMWKLEGFDPAWIQEDNLDRATYTNLNPGQYTFRLKLIDQLGNLLAPEKQLTLLIQKPYWETNWAYLLYSLFLLSLIALLLYAYRLRMESKNAAERLHFLIEMAHEIKTPLTLIRAPITDLLNNNKTDKQFRESLEVALKSTEKLHKQMRQFLDFRRINVRKSRLQVKAVDLIELINTTVFAFKSLAEKKEIELIFQYKQAELILKSDEQILEKIIGNLISNAVKYTPANGIVHLSLEANPKKWILSVKDTGIGISKEDQKKIFTLFFRAENARNSDSTGSGVGLVLAYDLAKTLGGSVRLESSGSSGSEFLLIMPMTSTVEAKELRKEKETQEIENQRIEEGFQNGSKVKVLIVEDDDDLRLYQKHKFERKFDILTASNGEEALTLVQSSPPDLILSDVMMPKMNGWQLCANIKSNLATSHIPFILLTGLESKEHEQLGFESGADDYISKPIDFRILSSKIDNLFHTRTALKDKLLTVEEMQYQDLSNELDQQFLDEVTQLIEDNISDPELSVSFLCQAVGMSRTSFYHKLKALVDLSPSEFIRTIRLKRAKKLLLNPNHNISEVAYSAGFSDAKYFSTLFKKYFQQSPSSWRNGR
ncbi:MAG: helix-turn-helix domain-containing protein [Bacteroidota bacterium]